MSKGIVVAPRDPTASQFWPSMMKVKNEVQFYNLKEKIPILKE